jgi:toxin CptA
LLLLAALRPDQVWLPHDAQFHLGIVVGGLLLGLGAMVNGGCYLGSVLYLGTGNLNFLFTLAGIGLGLRAAASWAPLPAIATPGLKMVMGASWLAGLGMFALIIAVLLYHRRFTGQWLALLAGLLAGLVYARSPGWSYGSTLEALAHGRLDLGQWRGELYALSLFAGAIGAAALGGQFRLQRLMPWRVLRCLCGGAILGYGAALIPGGNDSLLLWAIPGLTLYGALAFGLMLGAIGLGFALAERRRRQRPLAH